MLTGTPLLTGVTVPLVTPMEPGGRPSAERSTRLLDALYAHGVRTLMLLGSNGEGPLVPASDVGPFTAGVIARWRELGVAAGPEPGREHGRQSAGIVTVNVTAAGTLDVLARADAAAAAGADALVLSPPIYFHHRADEVVAHYAALAAVGLPVVAYNAPRYSNPITPGLADALADLDHVVGIKDSSGDLALLEHLVGISARRPGFAVGQGAETQLAAALDLGAHGIVPGVGNIAPGPALALVAAHRAGETAEVARLQQVLTDLTGLHKVRPGTPSIKTVLARRGLCPPHVAPPLLACDPGERAALRAFVTPFEEHLI
ncbi:4-hydroxy-tetrahydrodipicolinate synthase [Promicromonospora sp. AC04]|uniref:dihydrodipicolinate synthase family protein n=1 Tax=Promicromonospora sp. AC04 TaxID=2135723 RepID=UPI000D42ADCF|nr:dihydrodipicolinate synthase family protein [Promicromonospora sp. AC04]PUB26268.1 4-hydroxy-tetrahydrodipicolinate synthase [Promicromonospora sp. AC04]